MDSTLKHESTAFKGKGKTIFRDIKIKPIKNGYLVKLMAIGFIMGRVIILDTLTPFGVAFLMAIIPKNKLKYIALIGTSIALGSITRINGIYSIMLILSLISLVIFTWTFKLNKKSSALRIGEIGFLTSFFISITVSFYSNNTFILYDTLLGLFNSAIIISLYYIFRYCIPVLEKQSLYNAYSKVSRKFLSNEEFICISIIWGLIISGMSDLYIFGLSVKLVLSVFLIATVAYGRGAGIGTALGTTIGLISGISSNQAPIIIGTFAFCGLLCGVFREAGKLASSLGFIAADVIMMFYLGANYAVLGVKETILGIIIFNIFPRLISKSMMPFVDYDTSKLIEQQSYMDRIKDIIQGRLSSTIHVFDELAKALKDGGEYKDDSKEFNLMVNSIAEGTCSNCDARDICWERNFYNTYKSLYNLLDAVYENGEIDLDNIPGNLKDSCIKPNTLVKYANHVFNVYKMNYKWRSKIEDGRKVVYEQLNGISQIIEELSMDISKEVSYKKDIEEEVAVALDKEGIGFIDVAVRKGDEGRMEVDIYKRPCLGRRECVKTISPIVSKAINKRMKRDWSLCNIKNDNNVCCFKLVEEVNFQVSTGVARSIKDKTKVSGDSYSFMEIGGGKYMIVISDGMGTGLMAAKESGTAIDLLEKYMEAGFDKSTALRAINSAMAFKSPDDNFATIDICIVDLYSAEAEFTKIGAVSTFIKRSNNTIEEISATTLPIGILSSIDIESKKVQLEHGDMIIMVTDGVQEAGGKSGGWIKRFLEQIESGNPKQVAEEFLQKAKEREKGEVYDDMTVLVSKIWRVL